MYIIYRYFQIWSLSKLIWKRVPGAWSRVSLKGAKSNNGFDYISKRGPLERGSWGDDTRRYEMPDCESNRLLFINWTDWFRFCSDNYGINHHLIKHSNPFLVSWETESVRIFLSLWSRNLAFPLLVTPLRLALFFLYLYTFYFI